jgi:hypothetical protein
MDTASQKIVLVAINDESADKEVNFSIDGLGSATFSRYITSINQDLEQLDDITVNDTNITVTLPNQTITTFVSDRISRVGNEALAENLSGYGLNQNFPNPFHPSTVIGYQLPANSEVSLKVVDMLGREVATLVEGWVDAGIHETRFDASGFSSGVYIYTLTAGHSTISKRMLLIR